MKILITEKQIEEKISELAKKISSDYHDRELTMIGVLKGSFIFMADLIRELTVPVEIDFIETSSYEIGKISSGVVRITKDLNKPITGKNILLVEDIVDTGLTLNSLVANLKSRNPSSIKIISLLVKKDKHKMESPPDYFGFEIDDDFVVGYGLDFNGRYRNLKNIEIVPE